MPPAGKAGTGGTLLPPMLAASPDAFPAQALCRTNRAQRSALSSLEKKKKKQ